MSFGRRDGTVKAILPTCDHSSPFFFFFFFDVVVQSLGTLCFELLFMIRFNCPVQNKLIVVPILAL